MNHIRALAIKFIASFALLYIILGMIYGMPFGNVFIISLVLGITAYIIGDLILLPRTNNLTATVADLGLAFLVIWIMSINITYVGNLFTMSLIASLGVALFEYVFHKYVSNNVINNAQADNNQPQDLQYQTEASEELSPETNELKNNNKE